MEQYQEVCRITMSAPNYTCIFLDFFHGFGSYVKGLPKMKQSKSVFFFFVVVVFWVYVKLPLLIVKTLLSFVRNIIFVFSYTN